MFNELHIVVVGTPQERADIAYIRGKAQAVAQKVERAYGGVDVDSHAGRTPRRRGHPTDDSHFGRAGAHFVGGQ